MLTTIYCYTSTGNSLMIARTIAERLGDTEILPIARFRKERASPASGRVGIIFPIHAWGPPRTVSEFIENLDLGGVRYTFAIASCGGTAAGTLPLLRRAIRKHGGELHAGFIVRSTGYMEARGDDPPIIQMVRRLSGTPFPTDRERLPQIIETVKGEKRVTPERNALLGTWLGNFFHTQAGPQFAKLDANYVVSESCKGCGRCSRICPRGNITLQDGRPTWHHDCDNCGACATWCAQNAIGFTGVPTTPRRHHPQVVAEDLVWA
jgi:ferredoxin/flavodoxin